jgi:hypothetical protein
MFLPWESVRKAYVKGNAQGKFHLRYVNTPCTIIPAGPK